LNSLEKKEGLLKSDRRMGSSGFTLIEVLISITITAILVTIIFMAFRLGSRAWERGEQNLEPMQRQRAVLNLLQKQLSSICTCNISRMEGKPSLLQGTPAEMTFLSNTSIIPGSGPGIVKVTYRIMTDKENKSESLLVHEESLSYMPVTPPPSATTGQNGFKVLLANYYSIQFEYFEASPATNAPYWQEKWKAEQKNKFPGAVKITLVRKDGEPPIGIEADIVSKPEAQ
jgi:general secretion pathway protein J